MLLRCPVWSICKGLFMGRRLAVTARVLDAVFATWRFIFYKRVLIFFVAKNGWRWGRKKEPLCFAQDAPPLPYAHESIVCQKIARIALTHFLAFFEHKKRDPPTHLNASMVCFSKLTTDTLRWSAIGWATKSYATQRVSCTERNGRISYHHACKRGVKLGGKTN